MKTNAECGLRSADSKATPRPWSIDIEQEYAPGTLCIIGNPEHKQAGVEGSGCCIARVAPPENTTEVDVANAELIAESVNNYDRLKEVEAAAKPLLDDILDAANGNRKPIATGNWASKLNRLAVALAASPESADQSQSEHIAMLEAVAECASLMLDIKTIPKHDLCTCSTCRLRNALDRLETFKSKAVTK